MGLLIISVVAEKIWMIRFMPGLEFKMISVAREGEAGTL